MKTNFIIFLFFFFLLIFLLAISLQRYFIFQVFYDFGYFVHILFQLSRFNLPYINHLVLGKILFLGDHFNPSLIILTPLFWITSNPLVLLIEQAVVTFFNSIIIFLISVKKKLNYLSALIITFSFIIFAGTTNPLLSDWHPEPTAALFLLLFIYFSLFTKRKITALIMAIVFLGFKESNSLTLIFVLFWLILLNKKRAKEYLLLMLISLIWFLITTYILIPFISKKYYLYSPEISLSFSKIFPNILTTPEKLKYLFYSFTSFGFLPLFSGFAIIPVLGELSMKLIPTKSLFANFNFTLHYHVYLGVFLALGTIWTIADIKNKLKKIKIIEFFLLGLLLFSSVYTARKITQSPINLAFNLTFWKELKPRKEMFNLISRVPKYGTVMSHNNLLPYLATRTEDLYYLSTDYKKLKPDIIVFDATPDQAPNNYWESQPEKLAIIINMLKEDKNYQRIKFTNPNYHLYLRKKNNR